MDPGLLFYVFFTRFRIFALKNAVDVRVLG